jgi:hypothetical protein|tara:strand:- start:227 stop:1252 length:1026 start_codon:yes stop_codon:yes gene_type:complete
MKHLQKHSTLLINHNRFINEKTIIENKGYYDFFNNYAKENYTLEENYCLCMAKNDQYISRLDRYSVLFDTVICKNCGLVRANKYYKTENVIDLYKNHYRKIMSNNEVFIRPSDLFENQINTSIAKFNLIKNKANFKLNDLKILDLGGGAGGALQHFKVGNELYLADYFDPYLDYAKTKGINVIKGGIENITFKPDIIILSHVIEHWSDFEYQIKNLINIQKKNQTINYIEFPGIDSLKLGRRGGDFLEDIHIPHVYYFTSYVFENLMNRYGFEKLYINSNIESLFIYTGNKKKLINHFNEVKNDLIQAEYTRKICLIKKFIKKFIPKKILEMKDSLSKNLN